MSINKTRGFLYRLARLLGDFSAISSGSSKKMTRRVGRRVTGRAAGKTMRLPQKNLFSEFKVSMASDCSHFT